MTIVITGAAGGIGGAIVDLALERGLAVIAHDLDAAAIADRPGVQRVGGNLLDAGDRAALADAVGDHEIHAAIAAHGIAGDGALADLRSDRVRAIMSVNFATIPMLFATLRPALRDGGGAFVAIASQASLRAERDNGAYCASKWAVIAWVQAVSAAAWREDKVRVRALCPGRTHSPLLETAMAGFAAAAGEEPAAYRQRILDGIPLHRFAAQRETASAALHLASRDGGRPTILANTGGEVPF
jgi:NAD(P)-dependent dehydrogenase (short-subunit alcohol dehydrogenase family)